MTTLALGFGRSIQVPLDQASAEVWARYRRARRDYITLMPLFFIGFGGDYLISRAIERGPSSPWWQGILGLVVMLVAFGAPIFFGFRVGHRAPSWHPGLWKGRIVVPVFDRTMAEEFVALNGAGTVTLQ
jgi:hypothetical protein